MRECSEYARSRRLLLVLVVVLTQLRCGANDVGCAERDQSCSALGLFLLYRVLPCSIERRFMVACYGFEGTASDSGPSSLHATLFGVAEFMSGVGGLSAQSYHVSQGDTASYVMLPDAAVSGLADFTIAFWGRLDSAGTNEHYFLSVANTGATNGQALGMDFNASTNTIEVHLDTTLLIATASSTVPLDRQWHGYAYLREGSEIRLYLDGTLINTTPAISTNLTNSGPDGAALGQEIDTCCPASGFAANQTMAGSIDNLAIYNHALGHDAIRALLLY